MTQRSKLGPLILFGLVIARGTVAAVPDPQAEPSAEVRQQMAAIHEQMAACLRSDKALSACRAEMMKSCQEQLGSECRMLGHGSDAGRRMHPMGPAPK
jgi:hypothetical protein